MSIMLYACNILNKTIVAQHEFSEMDALFKASVASLEECMRSFNDNPYKMRAEKEQLEEGCTNENIDKLGNDADESRRKNVVLGINIRVGPAGKSRELTLNGETEAKISAAKIVKREFSQVKDIGRLSIEDS